MSDDDASIRAEQQRAQRASTHAQVRAAITRANAVLAALDGALDEALPGTPLTWRPMTGEGLPANLDPAAMSTLLAAGLAELEEQAAQLGEIAENEFAQAIAWRGRAEMARQQNRNDIEASAFARHHRHAQAAEDCRSEITVIRASVQEVSAALKDLSEAQSASTVSG